MDDEPQTFYMEGMTDEQVQDALKQAESDALQGSGALDQAERRKEQLKEARAIKLDGTRSKRLGRPPGSKGKKYTVKWNPKRCCKPLASVLERIAIQIVEHTSPEDLVKHGKTIIPWLELIDHHFNGGRFFPKKPGHNKSKNLTQITHNQLLAIPPMDGKLDRPTPQTIPILTEEQGGGGYPPEGGNPDQPPSLGYPLKNFFADPASDDEDLSGQNLPE